MLLLLGLILRGVVEIGLGLGLRGYHTFERFILCRFVYVWISFGFC
jgi:hypothetical protein